MARVCAIIALVGVITPGLAGCRSERKRPPAARHVVGNGGVRAVYPEGPTLRVEHEKALFALLAGRKDRGEKAVARVKRGLLALEARARQACVGPGRAERRVGPENRAACALRAELVAINDRLAHRLDPGDPLAEQVELLGWLSGRIGRQLGEPLAPPPVAVTPAPGEPLSELAARPEPPRPWALSRCRLGPERVLVPSDRGAAWAHLGRLGEVPTLLWVQRCARAEPPCDQDALWLQSLGADGRAQGPPRRVPIDPTLFDGGAPVALLGEGGVAPWILYVKDGDPYVHPLRGQTPGKAQGRPLLVRGDALRPRRGTSFPVPAWLSLAPGRAPELRIFGEWAPWPVARIPLAGAGDADKEHSASAPFGEPGLVGLPEGFLVASMTLSELQVDRLGRLGERLGPGFRVRFPSAFDPECALVAASDSGRYALAVGRNGKRLGGLLVGLDAQGRPERLPVSVPLPFAVPSGCPLELVATRGRLMVVGTGRTESAEGEPVLRILELGPDGRQSGPPRPLGSAAGHVGALATASGALVVWQTNPAQAHGPGSGAVMARAIRCP